MPSTKLWNLLTALLAIVFGFLVIAVPLFASEQVLHDFCYGSTCGGGGDFPFAGVIFGAAGNLYGTTSTGDAGRGGVVYELIPHNGQWTAKTLLLLSGKHGSDSRSSLILDTAGNLYGTTLYGGTYDSGVVFELIPNSGRWTTRVLYSFNPNHKDGLNPYGSPILAGSGNLYGTTYNGGTHNSGTVFELMHNNGKWTHRVLHNFDGKNGANPQAGVILDVTGNLYGTTYNGGTHNFGTVFELMHDNGKWTHRALHNFDGKNGANPQAGVMILDKNENLYGTTYDGGAYHFGTVFELMPNHGKWAEKVLHSFNLSRNGNDGILPVAAVILDKNGDLYGTTEEGGFWGGGTVFKLRPRRPNDPGTSETTPSAH